ncbi:MAG: DUF4209 domain-containing protein [Alistipes sp.]|uniref:DUF4209 domain-containing protein n=1 Tax=Alistipes TaxID=239759 RepID=UPI001DB25436|nr:MULTISPECIES: DUF4209 domain-containing protein [Alistipes]MBS5021416.1 DUF4209 domain-containing protein [Alistipes sp.]
METLLDYYAKIDSPEFEGITSDDVLALLPHLDSSHSDYNTATREWMAFIIQKSFDNKDDPAKGTVFGLSWITIGKDRNAAGEEIDIYVPDVRNLKPDDFEYYENRYKACQSLFPKTEYGLLAYFGHATPYSKRNDFKSELGLKLSELAKIYWDKSLEGGEHNPNFQHYFRILTLAFNIFQRAKLTAELDVLCAEIIDHHDSWDIHRGDSLRGMLDLSGLMADNYSLFKDKVDFNQVVEKNLSAAHELEKTYTWGAIYIVDRCIKIRTKQNADSKDLIYYKAQLYEKMAGERAEKFVCLTFIEKALRLYKIAQSEGKVAQMEAAYMATRSQITFNTEFFKEFPPEYLDYVTKMIKEKIDTSDENGILSELTDASWFTDIAQIKAQAEVNQRGSLVPFLATTVIKDKFGNTVDQYITDEEIKEMFFWEEYGFAHQIGMRKLHQFILEVYKAGKLSYDSLLRYLENTWFNVPVSRTYNGQHIEVRVLDVLRPGLKLFFSELEASMKDLDNYEFDYITVTDTLTLKIESILRLYCERIGIPTMKPREKAGVQLMMEKLLDDLLSDLKDTPERATGFREEDRLLLKYVLTLKGHNLRNRVAHGLMEAWEYNYFPNIVILLVILLRLSNYFK